MINTHDEKKKKKNLKKQELYEEIQNLQNYFCRNFRKLCTCIFHKKNRFSQLSRQFLGKISQQSKYKTLVKILIFKMQIKEIKQKVKNLDKSIILASRGSV